MSEPAEVPRKTRIGEGLAAFRARLKQKEWQRRTLVGEQQEE